MNRKTLYVLALIFFVMLWAVFSWPLGKHLFTGIPSSGTNLEKGNVIRMVPGDHLQLLYNFWLAKDMMSGDTPLFYNLYEFNTGSDEARLIPRPYYAPASILYALISHIGGDAFGWNMSGMLCVLIGFWGCWRLARRFVSDELTALALGVTALVIPYTWVSLLGGSPAGFGVVWVPVLFLGLDQAIRSKRAAGGVLAGVAILFASWTDSHVFFFSMLAIPCWCLLCFTLRESVDLRDGRNWRELIVALLPAVVLGAVAVVLFQLEHAHMLGGTTMADGRTDAEIGLFSPEWTNLFGFSHGKGGAQVYVGYVAAAVLGLGFILLLIRPPNMACPPWRVRLFMVMLFVGLVGVAVLALGLSGPLEGKAYVIARKLVSPFEKIRQPPKIFCLIPALLCVALPMCGAALVQWLSSPRLRHCAVVAIALLLIFTYKLPISATICLIDSGNEAYRVIADDATNRGLKPRAIAIPLWPGDSAWTSLNEHYASLYRIRMVNGYSPFVQSNYIDDVFFRFESLNKGALDAGQLTALREMGVEYLVLHENAFPEKVSPFPVAFTLKRFLNHPYLERMHQSGEIWSFRILDRPRRVTPVAEHWRTFGPSLMWDLSHNPHGGVVLLKEPSSWRGLVVQMNATNAWIETIHAPRAVSAPELHWLLRARGEGQVETTTRTRERRAETPQPVAVHTSRVDSVAWDWIAIPIDVDPANAELSARLVALSGHVDVDMLMLVAGTWDAPRAGQAVSVPAACFFHAGYSDLKNGCVVLRPDTEPDRTVFYGPRMPINVGPHSAELVISTTAPEMTLLGRADAYVGLEKVASIDILSGRPAHVAFHADHNLPFELRFTYSRNAQVCLHRVILSHLETPKR